MTITRIAVQSSSKQSVTGIKMNMMGSMREEVTKMIILMEIVTKEEGIGHLRKESMLKQTGIPASAVQGMTGVTLPHKKATWIRLVVALGVMDNWSMERMSPSKMRHFLSYQNMGPGIIPLAIKEVGKVGELLLRVGRRVTVLCCTL
jgi:hypothetical protein